jgi:hypothetical protein
VLVGLWLRDEAYAYHLMENEDILERVAVAL